MNRFFIYFFFFNAIQSDLFPPFPLCVCVCIKRLAFPPHLPQNVIDVAGSLLAKDQRERERERVVVDRFSGRPIDYRTVRPPPGDGFIAFLIGWRRPPARPVANPAPDLPHKLQSSPSIALPATHDLHTIKFDSKCFTPSNAVSWFLSRLGR